MKKYNVALSNDSCIFDSFEGFDTIEEAIEFSIGRGGRYVIQLDAGKAEEGEFLNLSYDSDSGMFSHYGYSGLIEIKPEDVKKYVRQYIWFYTTARPEP